MSDSKRCSIAENMLEKVTKIYSWQGAASKMFRDSGANSMARAMLISYFDLHILPKVSKTGVILAKTHKNLF
jgi:hypothetical protein